MPRRPSDGRRAEGGEKARAEEDEGEGEKTQRGDSEGFSDALDEHQRRLAIRDWTPRRIRRGHCEEEGSQRHVYARPRSGVARADASPDHRLRNGVAADRAWTGAAVHGLARRQVPFRYLLREGVVDKEVLQLAGRFLISEASAVTDGHRHALMQ